MTSPDIEPRIRKWLAMLADLTIAGTEAVTTDRIATIAGMLAKDAFPGWAYSSDSLHHVAQEQRFFPAYDDIRRGLSAWWEAHKPAPAPMLSGPGMSGMEPNDRSWMDLYHRRRAEIFAEGYEFVRGSEAADLANLVSLVRQQSPRAWAYILGGEI